MKTEEEMLNALKLLLVQETRQNFRLKELYKTELEKEFDEAEVEKELIELKAPPCK